MRLLGFFIGAIIVCHCSLAQKRQAAIWHYGIWNKLDFNSTPVKVSQSPWWNDSGTAAICDSSGRLQFFSTGEVIVDRKDSLIVHLQQMFLPHSTYGQFGGNIIIPYQNDPNRYFYFNLRHEGGLITNRIICDLYRFEVNMNKRGGQGGLDTVKTKIISDSLGTQLACALHVNGKDTWLIGRKYHSDSLVAWLVQDTGIAQVVYSKLGSPTRVPNIESMDETDGYDSQIKTSPNSELLLIPRRTIQYPIHELYRFNRETGQVYGRIGIRDTTKPPPFFLNGFSDGAFSPDSKVLYVGTGTRTKVSRFSEGPGHIWQFSLENYDSLSIAQSRIYLGLLGRGVPNKPEPRPFFPRFQLAMDGNIYVSPGSQSDTLLSVIHCPNNLGQAAQLRLREITLYGSNGAYFPTLNQTFVRNAGIFQLQANKRSICQGDTLELSAYGAGAEHFNWSVSPALPQAVKVDTLTWQKISTANIPPGSYTFRCVGTSRCNDVLEKSMVVEIRPRPLKPLIIGNPPPFNSPSTGSGGHILCMYDTIRLSVPDTLAHYYWSTADTTSAIRIVGWNASGTRWFSLVTENEYGCQSEVSDSVAVTMKDIPPTPQPVISSVPFINADSGFVALCQGDSVTVSASGAETYAWSDGNRQAIRHLTGTGSLILYGYDTAGCAAKAETGISYKTLPNPQPVFVMGDTVLNLNTLAAQNYCVPLVANHHYTWSATNGTITDTLADCATVNWNGGPVNRFLEVLQTSPVGCVGLAKLQIAYQPDLKIPNFISPNGDGMNDVFEIQDLEFYATHHLQIFNRWGKKVLDTTAYKQDWKGETGIYFYNLTVDGKPNSGWVDVVK